MRVGGVGVDAGADDELALIRLTDVDVHRVRHDDAVEDRLDRLGNERLQGVALDRQAEAGHAGEHARMSGDDDADLLRADRPARRLDACDAAARNLEGRHLAILNDVDAEAVGGARKTPGDRVMAGNARAPLQSGAEDRVAQGGAHVEDRAEGLDARRIEPLGIDAVQAVGIDAPARLAHVAQIVGEVHDAALGQHDVVVEILRQSLEKLQRFLVEEGAFVPEIVRAADGGVAARIAATEPALFQHGDVANAVLLGEIVGGSEAVTAAADDYDVVGGLGVGAAPLLRPTLMMGECVAGEAQEREACHGRVTLPNSGSFCDRC